ncbi:MAG: membrane integrity-associated transporter subunit PqiC, partial [Calditrichaeota bacterium]|nr:membrane integrity-associated transporter subunit PqiC [Calditrichota bacterium]
PLTLGVGGFDCDVLYEGERIVYRNSPYEVQYYHYRRWVAPPRKLVADAVQQQFSASGSFRRVVSSTAGEPVDYLLRGKINAFEEWDEEEAWFGSVAIEFVLYDADNGAVIWQNRYAEKTPAAQKDPLMVVEAISASLQRVVARAREDVAAKLR